MVQTQPKGQPGAQESAVLLVTVFSSRSLSRLTLAWPPSGSQGQLAPPNLLTPTGCSEHKGAPSPTSPRVCSFRHPASMEGPRTPHTHWSAEQRRRVRDAERREPCWSWALVPASKLAHPPCWNGLWTALPWMAKRGFTSFCSRLVTGNFLSILFVDSRSSHDIILLQL